MEKLRHPEQVKKKLIRLCEASPSHLSWCLNGSEIQHKPDNLSQLPLIASWWEEVLVLVPDQPVCFVFLQGMGGENNLFWSLTSMSRVTWARITLIINQRMRSNPKTSMLNAWFERFPSFVQLKNRVYSFRELALMTLQLLIHTSEDLQLSHSCLERKSSGVRPFCVKAAS